MERHVDELRPAFDRLDLRLDLDELVALLRVDVVNDAADATDQAGIDERIEPDGNRLVLQGLFDLRGVDLFGADVVDDLDALALFHVVDEHLAEHAIGVSDIAHLDREVVEEVRRPSAA